MRSKIAAAALAWLMIAAACSNTEPPGPRPQHEVTSLAAPLWSNGDFDNDAIGATPPSGWSVTTYLNANGVTGSSTAPPATFAALNLATSGGKLETYVVGGPVEGQADPDLGTGQAFRFPKYGTRAARVNYKNSTDYGKAQSANALRQTMTIELGDIDPNDGQIHVRFVVAPVLENPSHGFNQQPYFFIQLQNLTRGTTLYHDFNTAGQTGVPWKTTTSVVTGNTTQWLNWQLIDLAPGPTAISVGDSVQLTVIASGCQPSGHFGRVYVDGVGPSVPGLFTWATGPGSAPTSSNIVYTIYYTNGGSSAALGAHVDMVTPPQTTYQGTSGITNCTTPATNGTGTISCPLGSLAAGSSGSFTVTVKVNSGATGSITNGSYSIGAVNSSDLLGAKVTTNVLSGSSISDVRVTQTANVTTTNWGQAVTLYIVIRNLGTSRLNNSSTSQLTLTDVFPSQLTNVMWTCALSSGSMSSSNSCNGGSGSGNLSAHPKLSSSNGEVTYTVTANVISGSGTSSLTNTPSAKVSSRTDPDLTNNSAPLTIPIGTSRTLTLTKTGSTTSGSVVSAPTALSCGTSCSSSSATFVDGSTVLLTATPIPGATFSGWSGACSGTARTCTLTISGDVSVGAAFAAPPAVGPAAVVYAYRGNNQSTRTSTAFGSPLYALVTDANGNALSGKSVTFTAVPNNSASASVTGSPATTNAAGIASASITANATAGAYTVTAAVSGVSTPATFSLTNVGAPNVISYVSGGNVSDPNRTAPGAAFAAPLTALVSDSSGNPVPGATVTFSAPGSGASATLSSTTATTDSSGYASITATANATAGSYLVHASVSGVSTGIDFSLQNVTSTPSSVFAISGTPQNAPLSTAFDSPLVVGVADSLGNALSGVTVAFSVPGSGASAMLTATSATTDSSGMASTAPTSNGTPGTYNVTASVSGAGSTTFALTNDGPQLIDVQSGDAQTASVGQAFQDLVAIVTNSTTGAPINGATVNFSVVPVGGATATLGAASATTNASGLASVTATAGTVVGSYTVTASTSQAGAPTEFNLTNVAGSAAAIAATSGSGQHATVSAAYASPLVATVTDSNNNPVSGVSVTFSAPGSGASATVTGSPATTDASGQASATVTANATVGAFDITAAASGAGSTVFHLTNDAVLGCTVDSDCTGSQYCDTAAHSCAAKLANGVAMPTVAGHTPTLNSTCTSPAAMVVCVSGVCGSDHKCGYPAGEGSCDGSSASSVCRSGSCSVSGVCMPSGGCATADDCNFANGGAACNAGSCQLVSCNAGFGDCDNSAANGCEYAVSDVQNCGACAHPCSLAHAVPACSNSSCTIGACDSGYAECNSNASDGCELFVGGSDRNHCGGCSTVCSASQYCSSGSCVMTLANSASCSAAEQCTSGVCGPDNLCGVANGGQCSDASLCRSGACSVSSVCMSSGGCLVDADCAGNEFCDTAQSQCVDKLDNGTSIPTIADHTPMLAGTCSNLVAVAVCSAGVCDSDDACGYKNGSGSCSSGTAASVCRSGVCGSDSKCGYPDLEGSCDNSTAATICRSQACSSGSHVCAAAGSCSVDSDCGAQQFCDTAAHSCVAKLSNGDELPIIAGHTPVLDGACSMAVGSAVCSAGVCDAGDSRCGLRNNQGPCTENNAVSVCRSGVCGGDGKCGYRAGEGSCTSGNAGNVCRTAECSTSSQVCIAANGCQVDSDCDNVHYCDTQLHACVTKLGNGVALPTTADHSPPLDGTCSAQVGAAVCAAGVCDSDNHCALVNGHGSCDTNNAGTVCRKGVCGSDLACGYLDGEGSCTSTTAGNLCRSGVCSISGVCRPVSGCVVAADCSFANAVAACNAGSCALASCNAGYADCNQSAADGCEKNIAVDAANCGACGATCSQSHGSSVCSAGSCGVVSCSTGYGDCNGSAADGCETLLRVDDAANCGACNLACNSAQFCAAGVCTSKRENESACTSDAQCSAGVCTLFDQLCGLVDDAPCVSADVCRGGACSQSHVCMASNSCRIDADCASDAFCDTSQLRCAAKLANSSGIPSLAGHDPELAGLCTPDVGSAVCSAGVCETSDKKCGYANGSGPCTPNNASVVCRSGVCGSDSKCGYLDGEGACTEENAELACRNGVCGSSSHVCVAPNQCLIDGDCNATHYCDTAMSVCRPKLGNAIAIPTVAGHQPELRGVCTLDAGAAVCSSSVCDVNDNKCGYPNSQGPCEPSSAGRLCRSGVCGGDGKCGYPEGEGPCTSLDAGERCRSGLCSAVSHVCVAADGCSVDGDCSASKFCDTERSRCVPKLDNGVLISVIAGHTPALTGTCNDAVGPVVCSSGVCDNNDDRCGYLNGDGSCSSGNAGALCRSGVCGGDGKCGYGDGEGSCSSANAGSVCRSKLCAVSGACRPVGGCVSAADCQFAHALASCVNRTCGWSACEDGFSDCNRSAADGCEVQTAGSDLGNCGGCGQVCSLAHASAVCVAGSCAIASCERGQADCDTAASSGCEVSIGGDDDLNCGACGARCTADQLCVAGRCSAKLADGAGPCSVETGPRVCRNGECANGSVCGAAVGCGADSDCADTEFCNTGSATCTAKLDNGRPIPSLPRHDPKANGVCNAAVGGALCAAGVCDDDDACGYLNGHGSCDEASAARVCRSAACGSDYKCGYLEGEGTCSDVDAKRVCRSGLCGSDQRCQAVPSCKADSDCEDGRFCDTSAHACTAKLAAGHAIPSIPGHVPPLSGSCNDDIASLVCSAGVCSAFDDACAFPNELGACDETNAEAMCRSGVCGSDTSCGYLEGEGSCTSLNAARVCRSGACGADGKCGPLPPCAADAECADIQFCDTDQQRCRSKLRNGSSLPQLSAAHEPPLTGKCSESAASSVCISGVCDAADDACGYANGAGSCDEVSAADLCRSRVCGGDQRCGYADGEGPCDAVIAARVCRSATCGSNGLCRARGCVSDAGCKDSQYCELASGLCKTRKIEAGRCASDSECVSGSCDLASGTCNSCVDGVCGHASLNGGGCSVEQGARSSAGALTLCWWLAVLGMLCVRRRQRRGSRH